MTPLQRFDVDCDKIVRGLALLDADIAVLTALKALTALPVNKSWSPAEIGARELAHSVISRVERHSVR